MAGQGHVRTRPPVDVLKVTRQGAAPIRCGCPLGCIGRGARWRNVANTNEPFMRGGDAALCQLLDPLVCDKFLRLLRYFLFLQTFLKVACE